MKPMRDFQKNPNYNESGVKPLNKIGYEISFNKYSYRHKPLRSMEDVTADILQL